MRSLILAICMLCLGLPSLGVNQEKPQPAANSPVGVWRKEDSRIAEATLTITVDKLVWKDSGVHVEADCSLTRDSLLFGVITKIAGQSFQKGPGEDDTFLFRFRADADELNVRSLKGIESDKLGRMVGRYSKVAEGDVAPPTAASKRGIKLKK
jgi:hypothetical protein